MKIALIAPPFIAVPPRRYGGTELFAAELAAGLQKRGISVVLYANGASRAGVETRWLYEKEEWPIPATVESSLKTLTHSSWAIKDALAEADLIHLNDVQGLSFCRFVALPFVYTVHHVFDPVLARFYETLPPNIDYVTISDFQRQKLAWPRVRTIHHGIDVASYPVRERKQPYLVFLGRIAPPKGTHLAIEIARQAGMPLKIAGEIQPPYKEYWESMVKPKVDGKFIEFIGEVGREQKSELLGNAQALLFPIQWEEPFGLVLIESMACGTPVLAMPGGSVEEIVKEGVGGHIRRSVPELAECVRNLHLDARKIRDYAEQNFSADRMAEDYIQLYREVISRHAAGAERSVA
jgi:glycosyltransferase involved in cell wall biosynthesis